jgi:hypothetical protein
MKKTLEYFWNNQIDVIVIDESYEENLLPEAITSGF